MKRLRNYFSPGEWLLWAVSVGLILLSFLIFDRENLLTLAASLIGVTSLIFNAKGNPIGQVLIVMWLMAAKEDPFYFSVAVCFILFLVNDLYGFFCWIRMRRAQSARI